jgi:hypothetical protein
MSKHIITKSNKIVGGYVVAAGLGKRLFILPGEVSVFVKLKEKLAEVIITVSNEIVPLRNNMGGLTRQLRTARIIVANSIRRRTSLILNEKQITTMKRAVVIMIFRTALYAALTFGGVRGAPHRLQAVRPSIWRYTLFYTIKKSLNTLLNSNCEHSFAPKLAIEYPTYFLFAFSLRRYH